MIENCYNTSTWEKVNLSTLTNLNISTANGFKYFLNSGDEICEDPPFIQANYKVHPGVVIAMSQFEEEVKANLRAVRYLLKETGIEKRIS